MTAACLWTTMALLLGLSPMAQAANRTFKDCPDCPEMVVIPPGSLPISAKPRPAAEAAAQPRRATRIESFALGKFEVTQAEWFAVMGDRPSEFVGDDLPVETVSWRDVQAFIRKLNARTGKHYRLPTEAEWEYAARAGSTHQYSFGDDASQLGQYAWFIDNAADTTHPVGQKLPNAFGLHDVHGNVWEWTQDCTTEKVDRASVDETVAKYIRDCHRTYRGGSMANKASSLVLTYTQSGGVGDRYFAMGFRIARTLRE